MPAVIQSQTKIQSDVLIVTRAEAKKLIPVLEALKRGDIQQANITDGTQILSIRKDGVTNISTVLSVTIADTTLAQNMTVSIAGHSLIRLLNAFRRWGDSVANYTLDVPNVPGNPTIRFQLAAGS